MNKGRQKIKNKKKLFIVIGIFLIVDIFLVIKFVINKKPDLDSTKYIKKVNTEPIEENIFSSSVSNKYDFEESEARDVEFTKLELEQINEMRSKTKLNLASLYTGQVAFFADFKRYTTDIKLTGNTPQGEGDINLKFGYLKAFEPEVILKTSFSTEDPGFMDSDEFVARELKSKNERYKYSQATESINLQSFSSYCEFGCTASKDSFEMILVFPYPNNKGYEVWTINQKKEIKQRTSSVK